MSITVDHWQALMTGDGPDQEHRLPAAFMPGYFNVDELGFEQMLALSSEFAAVVRFYNLENRVSGHWAELFMRDEAVIMALILSKDTGRSEAEYLRCREPDYAKRVATLLTLVTEVERWHKRLKLAEHGSGVVLGKNLAAMINVRLADNFHDIAAIAEYLRTQGVAIVEMDYGQFSSEWGVVKLAQGYTFSRARQFAMQDSTKIEGVLRTAFYSLLNGMSQLKEMAASALDASLKGQSHDPALGLFIAFLQLFKRLQRRINSFTQRHLDFYYNQVLHTVARERAPDSAHLLFMTEGDSSAVIIPERMEFSAGKDQKLQEIIYLADNPLTITDTRVSMVNTLYLERDTLISPEHELNYVTRIKAHTLPSIQIGGASDKPIAWPMFGGSSRGAAAGAAEDAAFGFAIASSVLLLKEGQRKITLTITLDDPVSLGMSLVGFCDYMSVNLPVSDLTDQTESRLVHLFSHFLSLEVRAEDRVERIRLAERAKALTATVSKAQLQTLVSGEMNTQCSLGYKFYLLACLQASTSESQFFHYFGRIFGRYLLCQQQWLDDEQKQIITTAACRLLSTESSIVIEDLLDQERGPLFYKLTRQLFTITLTTEKGWYPLKNYVVIPAFSSASTIENGLLIVMTLSPDVEAITPCDKKIHGDKWETVLPIVQLHVNPQSNFYPYSLFDEFLLREIKIDVDVQGARDILGYNSHGQVDVSKPFNPFGPIPNTSAYFSFGSCEVAIKNIQSLSMNIEWGGLPRDKGGFASHYDGYDDIYHNGSFFAELSVLHNGRWWPEQGDKKHRTSLFESEQMSEQISNIRHLNINVLNYAKPISITMGEDAFSLNSKSRNGLYRLMLAGTTDPFGYNSYPILLTRVLSQNARARKPKPIPNPPYVPLINQVTLNYCASSTVGIGITSSSGDIVAEKIFHLHPFGIEQVDAAMIEAGLPLLPAYHHDGNLHIGLSATNITGLITLFFDLAEDSLHTIVNDTPDLHWSYMANNRWYPLVKSQLVSDTTNGFLSSGIVTLNIPDGINKENTRMPREYYWLRVSSSSDLSAFCNLRAIYTQALRVRRRDNSDSSSGVARAWKSITSIAGLGKITQIGAILEGRQYEDPTQLKVRTSERLRHKQRATTAWDYEHLVMEKFPSVFKVKCFSHMSSADKQPKPGHLLVVVVPYLPESDNVGCSAPMINAVELEKIALYVRQLSSSFASIEVRNPMYEQVQVRCTVKFSNPQLNGLYTTQLDNDITHYICPWKKTGYQAKFGWAIRSEDIEAYIRSLDYVEYVTNFSMLHITEAHRNSFLLGDTARLSMAYKPGDDVAWSPLLGVDNDDRITPSYPWSLAVPTRHHFIETINKIRHIDAEPTGIGEIEIGSTFIINGTHSRG